MATEPTQTQIERRIVGGEVRAARAAEDGPVMLTGYGAVFNQETVIAGLFRETIDPAAFDDVLSNDVRAAVNHDPNLIIGRVRNGTLRLSTDETGLRYEVDLNPADPDAQAIGAKVARGDIDQSSFSFAVSPDGEAWDYSETKAGKLPLRRITHIDELYDTGPVAFAAYPQTSVSARAMETARAAAVPLLAVAEAAEAEDRAKLGRLERCQRLLKLAEAELE